MNLRTAQAINLGSLYGDVNPSPKEFNSEGRATTTVRADNINSVMEIFEYTDLTDEFDWIFSKPHRRRQNKSPRVAIYKEQARKFDSHSESFVQIADPTECESLPTNGLGDNQSKYAKLVLNWLPLLCFIAFAVSILRVVADLLSSNYLSMYSSSFTVFVFALLWFISLRTKREVYRQWQSRAEQT